MSETSPSPLPQVRKRNPSKREAPPEGIQVRVYDDASSLSYAEIETRLREDHKVRAAAVDGFPASQWIVLDYLQVIVHIFHQEKRDFYSLEDLWSDAPRLTIAGVT